MDRKHRLTNKSEFQRVRRTGDSYAHPLVVLVARPNSLDLSRFGFTAGRSVGGAVQRNRAKRRMREVARSLLPSLEGGWDLVLIARAGQNEAAWRDLRLAIEELLARALDEK